MAFIEQKFNLLALYRIFYIFRNDRVTSLTKHSCNLFVRKASTYIIHLYSHFPGVLLYSCGYNLVLGFKVNLSKKVPLLTSWKCKILNGFPDTLTLKLWVTDLKKKGRHCRSEKSEAFTYKCLLGQLLKNGVSMRVWQLICLGEVSNDRLHVSPNTFVFPIAQRVNKKVYTCYSRGTCGMCCL